MYGLPKCGSRRNFENPQIYRWWWQRRKIKRQHSAAHQIEKPLWWFYALFEVLSSIHFFSKKSICYFRNLYIAQILLVSDCNGKELASHRLKSWTRMKRLNNFEKVSTLVENERIEKHREEKQQSRRPIEVTAVPIVASAKRRQVQTYEPPPLFSTTLVFVFGAVIVLLANIWTPLALLFVWCAARLQRYFFRVNDDPTARRRLLKEFQRKDQLTAPLRHIPNEVKVEEAYWVNRRWVSGWEARSQEILSLSDTTNYFLRFIEACLWWRI